IPAFAITQILNKIIKLDVSKYSYFFYKFIDTVDSKYYTHGTYYKHIFKTNSYDNTIFNIPIIQTVKNKKWDYFLYLINNKNVKQQILKNDFIYSKEINEYIFNGLKQLYDIKPNLATQIILKLPTEIRNLLNLDSILKDENQ